MARVVLALFIAFHGLAGCAALQERRAKAPERLVVLVFDQFRPDYIDRYDLENFKRLRARSTEYMNAYVGHLPSVTIISHPVLNLGLMPRDLPWHDNVMKDPSGALGQPGLFYDTHRLSVQQFRTLMEGLPSDRSLHVAAKQANPGRTFVVAEKHYAALTFGLPAADSIVTMRKESGRCEPDGIAVPDYIAKNPRFFLECKLAYGTEDSFYPYDGARLIPGADPHRKGGDISVADAALEIMDREEWAGLFLSFGGIDRAGHLFGDIDFALTHPFASPFTLEAAIRTADAQLGRILDALEERDILDSTLIAVTADHGAQTNRYYLGNASGDSSGDLVNYARSEKPPFWIARLSKFGRVRATSHDSAIRIWLDEPIGASPRLLAAIAEISGVSRVYELTDGANGKRYARAYRHPLGTPDWNERHDDELVNTIAGGAGAPEYVVLLENGVGFDLLGEHGGAQETVQRIPMFISKPMGRAERRTGEVRLYDLNAILRDLLANGSH